jgi:hypothetical protein
MTASIRALPGLKCETWGTQHPGKAIMPYVPGLPFVMCIILLIALIEAPPTFAWNDCVNVWLLVEDMPP